MRIKHLSCAPFVLVVLLLLRAELSGAELKTLSGHVPPQAKLLAAKGEVPATNEMRLALGVPLRDAPGLEKFLQAVGDPRSASFRSYLTPEEFTARFGPTESDYAAVKRFAKLNGLKITGEHANRLVLDVSGPAAEIQRAFQIRLQRFQHPTEAREFFAPETEPVVDAALPLADVCGLSNYKMPHPKLIQQKNAVARNVRKSGSAPTGDFFGSDFRKAYVPDTTLTGAGQIVGLLQFDSYYPGDVAAYKAAAALPDIPVQTVLIGGFDGTPGSANGEVALDIELAMAMAPGLSKVICFSTSIDGFQNDVLSVMASSNMVKQFSCSWGWSGGPKTTTDSLFMQMAAQGQSFFNASGDDNAFTPTATSINGVDNPALQNSPSSSPYITQVGGTFLNTGADGARTSETVWNRGNDFTSPVGSGGGVSSYYAIPSWQAGTSMVKNKGSPTRRNIPDVAMVADYIYYYHDNGQANGVAGTSCSAPLWAGFTALINEKAALLGRQPVGLINAAVYALGNSADYPSTFNDVTVGDNASTFSPNAYFATAGYDLCTGWGTPKGQKLIDALAGLADNLQLSPAEGFVGSGTRTGTFSPDAATITLSNSGELPVSWALVNSNSFNWLKVRPFKGTLAAGESIQLAVSYTLNTTNLPVGNYVASLKFTNYTARSLKIVPVNFQLFAPLSVTPAQGFTANGAVGGPFDIASQDFTVINRSLNSNRWRAARLVNWLDIIPTNAGAVAGNFGASTFTVALNTNANRLPAGEYATVIQVFNQSNQRFQNIPFKLRVGQNIISNGGFETGDFRGWTLAAAATLVTNRTGYVHGGTRSALLGQEGSLGYLVQTLPTQAGQTYQLSLWLANPKNNLNPSPNQFSILWEGNTIYDRMDIPFTNWMNLRFTVTATANGSRLQFGFRDDPFYLALDDVTLRPVPAPLLRAITQQTAAPMGNAAAAAGANPAPFSFHFAVTPGYRYQVQWKTNLLQPEWMDFGPAVAATKDSLDFTDPATAGHPQKFYRLKLVP
jgi:hypothetical protein